jgi:hypothetical protein
MTFSMTTLIIKGLVATLSINDAQHNNILPYWVQFCWVSLFINGYANCPHAERRGAINWLVMANALAYYFNVIYRRKNIYSFVDGRAYQNLFSDDNFIATLKRDYRSSIPRNLGPML